MVRTSVTGFQRLEVSFTTLVENCGAVGCSSFVFGPDWLPFIGFILRLLRRHWITFEKFHIGRTFVLTLRVRWVIFDSDLHGTNWWFKRPVRWRTTRYHVTCLIGQLAAVISFPALLRAGWYSFKLSTRLSKVQGFIKVAFFMLNLCAMDTIMGSVRWPCKRFYTFTFGCFKGMMVLHQPLTLDSCTTYLPLGVA